MSNFPKAAANLQLLALDVDGVLTDGTLYFSAQGDEIKAFNILDGLGIKQLLRHNITVAIITGRSSPLTARRARDLGIEHLKQGREDKLDALRELSAELNIPLTEMAYMGDDLPDLGAIRQAGLGITVPNGHSFVRQHADWQTENPGGSGAVREVCDLILQAKNLLKAELNGYLGD
jgi:3-deoxy-D-manno-octulosonate 8-phosphate phosphatase (KDO 8-P phosphatase)